MKKKTWIPVKGETETKDVTTEETINEEEQEVKEMGFFKKHGAKIGVGIGIAVAGLAGFLLGSKSGDEEETINTGFEPVDTDEVPFDQDPEKDS